MQWLPEVHVPPLCPFYFSAAADLHFDATPLHLLVRPITSRFCTYVDAYKCLHYLVSIDMLEYVSAYLVFSRSNSNTHIVTASCRTKLLNKLWGFRQNEWISV